MKKKTIWAVIICAFIGICCYLYFSNSVKEKTETKDIIDWNEIVEVKISGYEGNSDVQIEYKEIPGLLDKIQTEEEKWEEIKYDLIDTRNNDEINKNMEWITSLRKLKNKEYCQYSDNWDELKNGDILTLICGNETLKALNYDYDNELVITVEGLKIVEKVETDNETNYSERVKKEDQYTVLGNDMFFTPADYNNINFEKTEGYRVILFVNTKTDLEKAIKASLSQENVAYIQYGEKMYTRESNYTEWEEFKGLTG